MFPEFVAIDFESPNGSPYDVCAVGMTRFDMSGDVKDEYYSLVRPAGHLNTVFNPHAIRVHNIYPEDVVDAPYWEHIAHDVHSFIGDTPLVAHSARSDRSMFFYASRRARLAMPRNPWYCTLKLSSELLPEQERYSLHNVFDKLFPDQDFEAHKADQDAWACGKIFSQLAPQTGDIATLDSICKLGPMHTSKSKAPAQSSQRILSIDPDEFAALLGQVAESSAFNGKNVYLSTKTSEIDNNSLALLVRMGGGTTQHRISNQTQVIILGANDPMPAKIPDQALCISELEIADFIDAGALLP
ncbi:MAG: exonuclease domain-containing protein [Corynebacterium sp.]|nr:exonuclease domain-containing protein [Corynebacterium sp.]